MRPKRFCLVVVDIEVVVIVFIVERIILGKAYRCKEFRADCSEAPQVDCKGVVVRRTKDCLWCAIWSEIIRMRSVLRCGGMEHTPNKCVGTCRREALATKHRSQWKLPRSRRYRSQSA